MLLCVTEQRDRGSTTSLSSDFSLMMENSPGAAGSFSYDAVELMLTGPQASWSAPIGKLSAVGNLLCPEDESLCVLARKQNDGTSGKFFSNLI